MNVWLPLIVLLISFSEAETTRPEPRPNARGDQSAVRTLDVTDYGLNRNCARFVRSNGTLGEWGEDLHAAILRVGKDCFYNQADFSPICPSFPSFSDARKQQFLAFLFAAIAHYESTCREAPPRVQGTNDIADGLFQLEYSRSQRRDAGRDRLFCVTDRAANTRDIKFQMECGASIFRDGYCDRNNRVGSDSWYWQKLNRTSRKISKVAAAFPGCK